MQALPDRVTVLVDEALTYNEVDIGAAKSDLEAATQRQKEAGSDLEAYAREQTIIDFAQAKLRIVGQ